MNLAYKKILGKFTKVLGFGKTPPPCWESFPNNIVFFWERTLLNNFEVWSKIIQRQAPSIFIAFGYDWNFGGARNPIKFPGSGKAQIGPTVIRQIQQLLNSVCLSFWYQIHQCDILTIYAKVNIKIKVHSHWSRRPPKYLLTFVNKSFKTSYLQDIPKKVTNRTKSYSKTRPSILCVTLLVGTESV